MGITMINAPDVPRHAWEKTSGGWDDGIQPRLLTISPVFCLLRHPKTSPSECILCRAAAPALSSLHWCPSLTRAGRPRSSGSLETNWMDQIIALNYSWIHSFVHQQTITWQLFWQSMKVAVVKANKSKLLVEACNVQTVKVDILGFWTLGWMKQTILKTLCWDLENCDFWGILWRHRTQIILNV